MDTAALVERPNDYADLIKRLHYEWCNYDDGKRIADIINESADALEALTVERDALRTALQEMTPLLDALNEELRSAHTISGEWDGTEPDAQADYEHTARLIAAARAALQRTAVNQAGAEK